MVSKTFRDGGCYISERVFYGFFRCSINGNRGSWGVALSWTLFPFLTLPFFYSVLFVPYILSSPCRVMSLLLCYLCLRLKAIFFGNSSSLSLHLRILFLFRIHRRPWSLLSLFDPSSPFPFPPTPSILWPCLYFASSFAHLAFAPRLVLIRGRALTTVSCVPSPSSSVTIISSVLPIIRKRIPWSSVLTRRWWCSCRNFNSAITTTGMTKPGMA